MHLEHIILLHHLGEGVVDENFHHSFRRQKMQLLCRRQILVVSRHVRHVGTPESVPRASARCSLPSRPTVVKAGNICTVPLEQTGKWFLWCPCRHPQSRVFPDGKVFHYRRSDNQAAISRQTGMNEKSWKGSGVS